MELRFSLCNLRLLMERIKEKSGREYCLGCGMRITGRTDKLFCSDRCRSLYNYRKGRSRSLMKVRVMGLLEKNYEILDTLISQGVRDMEVSTLEMMGFKPECVTSFTIRGRLKDVWCYDIRYNMSGGRLFNIRRPLDILKNLP